MARNTKVGSMYVGVGMDTRDFNRKKKQLKSGTTQMGKDFKKLNDDISNLPFFGRFVDDFKRMADSIKSVVGVAKGASAVSGAGKGKAGVGGGKTRAAIAGLQAAEIAREAKADSEDRKLQIEQNTAIENRNALELEQTKIRRKYEDKMLSLSTDIKKQSEELTEEQKKNADFQRKFGQQSQRDKELAKLNKTVADLEATNQDAIKVYEKVYTAFQKSVEAGEKVETNGPRFNVIREQIRARNEEVKSIRETIDKLNDYERTVGEAGASISSLQGMLDIIEEDFHELTGKMEDDYKALDDKVNREREASIQAKLEADQKAKDATVLGQAMKYLHAATEKAGDGLARIGGDIAVGIDDTSRGDGKEGGSITGKVLTGLGVANLMKRFPKLNDYMMKFAKYALSTKASMIVVGGIIIGSVVAGLAVAVVSMVKFVKLGNEAAEQFDKLSKQSKLLGVNVNQLNRLRQQGIQLAGMEAKAVDVAIQRFTRRLADGTLDKKLADMGFTLQEISQLKMDNSANALEKVRVKFAGIASEGERLRLAFAMFDTEGAKFALALADQGKSIDEINAKMERYGLIVSANQQRALIAVKATNEELEMQAEGTSTQVGGAAAGVAESWNKLWLNIKEGTRIQDIFNFVAVKGMKLFEVAIDLVRVALIPVTALSKATFAIWDRIAFATEPALGMLNNYSNLLSGLFDGLRKVSGEWWGIMDPLIDISESTLELLGYEAEIKETLADQNAIRQQMAADREKELSDLAEKTKASERELEVLKKGEKLVRMQEMTDKMFATVKGGPMEGESLEDYKKRYRATAEADKKARAEYSKQYDEKMAAEKKIADFKEKRAKEIAAIENKHEEEMKRLNDTADRERSDAESAGSDRVSLLGSLFGSQSFTAGQSFSAGSSEEYSYLRDRKMAEQRRNEEKEARKEMQATLNSIDTHLEESLRIENAWYQSEANSYASDNVGVEANQFSGIDPS